MIPLAEKMRPEKLGQFLGQPEIVGKDSFLVEAIKRDQLPSLIFWGPPGTGKTTLANIIAHETKSKFIKLSAVSSGKKDLMSIINDAKANQRLGQKTIVFIDEIHRWNKAQQDTLLPFIENGTIVLIGATTENPSFEINSALMSRCRVLVLKELDEKSLIKIVENAIKDTEHGLGKLNLKIDNTTIKTIARLSNGDARGALNILETCAGQNSKTTVNLVKQVVQKSNLLYDKNGEEHYNIISALHKSLRGGDADAGLYWLVRMLAGGEDPLYIARRLLRFASEDVGLADNYAVVLANAVFESCHKIGLPECKVHLAQLVIYLAKTKKSISAYEALSRAEKDMETHGNLPVPLHLRNAPTKLMKDLSYGKNYKYTPHQDSSEQQYLPDKLKKEKYYK